MRSTTTYDNVSIVIGSIIRELRLTVRVKGFRKDDCWEDDCWKDVCWDNDCWDNDCWGNDCSADDG